MVETKQDGHRQNKRVSFIKEIEVVEVGIQRCSDISIGGLYLETVHHFPMGTLIDLRFKLHDADEHVIQVQARVLYVHEGVGIGLGFVNLNPDDHVRITKFIEQR